MVWVLLPGWPTAPERCDRFAFSDRGRPPGRHCLALALEARGDPLPGAPPTDEQHELRSSHHRPGSTLAAVNI